MKLKKYWEIYAKELGNGPLHRTKREAINEREELMKKYPNMEITIQCYEMTEAEYRKLGEHQGY